MQQLVVLLGDRQLSLEALRPVQLPLGDAAALATQTDLRRPQLTSLSVRCVVVEPIPLERSFDGAITSRSPASEGGDSVPSTSGSLLFTSGSLLLGLLTDMTPWKSVRIRE